MEKTYNGWTNYATWRVNLECIDSTQWVREDITGDEEEVLDIPRVAEFLQDAVEQMIAVEQMVGEYGERPEGLAYEYAMAFLGQVNWYEIAEHFAETYPSIMVPEA